MLKTAVSLTNDSRLTTACQFVKPRGMLSSDEDLSRKFAAHERKPAAHDAQDAARQCFFIKPFLTSFVDNKHDVGRFSETSYYVFTNVNAK